MTMLPSAHQWDKERLGDLYDPLTERGSAIAKDVIRKVCPDLASCPCVAYLSHYLYKRNLLDDDEHLTLSKRDPTGTQLSTILTEASRQTRGRGKFLVRDLILSLFDLWLDRYDTWCHSVAFLLREKAIEQLQLPHQLAIIHMTNFNDVAVPDITVPLSEPTTAALSEKLHQQHGPQVPTELNAILEKCRVCGKTVFDVVRAMMVTPGLGRHVSNLLPFHQSYPLEVLLFLGKLGRKWVEFAKFIGFEEEEVRKLRDLSPTDNFKQIQNFSKLWRMPDLTPGKNNDILDEVLRAADIRLDGVHVSPEVVSPTTVHIHNYGAVNISHPGQLYTHQSYPPTVPPVGDSQHEPRRAWTGPNDVNESLSLSDPSMRAWTGPNDVNESLSLSDPSMRPRSASSDWSEPWSAFSTHPTSVPAVQALPQHRHEVEYVLPPPSVHPERAPAISTDDTVLATSLLGRGLYGEVHVCKVEGSDKEYAAKLYHCQPELDEMKHIFSEKLSGLNNPNVVSYFGICHITSDVHTTQPTFVMERLVRNLATFLEKPNIQLHQKRLILLDVANGLGYLHERDLIHCDLTAQNVLMTAENRAKIADYANSIVKKLADMEIPTKTQCLEYLPEEARDVDYDKSVDVFSFGHLSLYVILQCKPYPLLPRTRRVKGRRPTPVSELERREKFITAINDKLSGTRLLPIVEYTRQCLSDEVSDRPAITKLNSILNHSE